MASCYGVVPAQSHVDLRLLGEIANAKQAELESETEFKGKFPACETAAIPPLMALATSVIAN